MLGMPFGTCLSLYCPAATEHVQFCKGSIQGEGGEQYLEREDGPHCRAVHMLLDNVVHHFWCALLWGFPGPSQCLQPQICLTPAHCFDLTCLLWCKLPIYLWVM